MLKLFVLSLTILIFSIITIPGECCLAGWFSAPSQENEVNSTSEVPDSVNKTLSDAVLKVFQMVIEKELKSNFTCPKPEGVYPHQFDCQVYYSCKNSSFTVENCEKDFGFDNKTLKCISDEKVELCRVLYRSTEIPCTSNGLQPHPTDCRKFVLCVNKIAYISYCTRHSYFDSEQNVCIPISHQTECVNSLLRLRQNDTSLNLVDSDDA